MYGVRKCVIHGYASRYIHKLYLFAWNLACIRFQFIKRSALFVIFPNSNTLSVRSA